MATLYVENVPDELYEAIRARAKQKRKSIAAEVLAVSGTKCSHGTGIEGAPGISSSREDSAVRAHAAKGAFPSTEEMQREDRSR